MNLWRTSVATVQCNGEESSSRTFGEKAILWLLEGKVLEDLETVKN